MHIEEGTSDVQLSLPKFLCDHKLGEHIPEPVPNCHFFTAITGSAGTGKTSMMVGLLTGKGEKRIYRKVFTHINVFIPQSSLRSIKGDPFKNHPSEKMYDTLDLPSLLEVRARCEEAAEEGNMSLILIDDMAAELKNKEIQKTLLNIILNRRHIRTSIMILSQAYRLMPLVIRKQLSHLISYKPKNKKEIESLFEELVFLDKKDAEELLRYVYKEKHDHLMLDTYLGKFYRNFAPLTLSSPDIL